MGVGTLYRHFPRRSDLIVAVLQHEIDDCVEAAEELATTLGPREGSRPGSSASTDFVGTNAGSPRRHPGDPAYDDLPQHLMDRLEPALQTLLARAVDSGYARADVTAREVLTTIALISQPVPGEQPSFNRRMTRVFMEGLAAPSGRRGKTWVQSASRHMEAVPVSVRLADRGRFGWTHDLRERRTCRFPTKSSRWRGHRQALSESERWWSVGLCWSPAGGGLSMWAPSPGRASRQFHHVGLALSGAMDGRMDDGTRFEVRPGDVFDVPPGTTIGLSATSR